MHDIKAIGFDLFDTLITVGGLGFTEAIGRLRRCLQEQGLAVQEETFLPAYRDAAQRFMGEARKDGRETHNRFWISAALQQVGHDITPHDPRVTAAVDAYFSAFLDHAAPLPATQDMLATLKPRYRLGLLSNFTHGPAVQAILTRLGLAPFLDVIIVSGELGFRKPHHRVFHELATQFDLPREQIAFIGDDVDADVNGARQAGLHPIRTTYAHAHKTAAGISVQPLPDTDPEVTSIASWDELLSLLPAS